MITNAAMKNGFTGGLIVDFPNSKKAKKYFLFLMAGYSEEIINEAQKAIFIPKGKDGEGYSDEEDADMEEGEDEQQDMDESSEEEKKIGVAKKKQHMSKTIWKAKKEIGRFKPNGNRKNKKWIMQKKARQRRQGLTIKNDSKYSGRKLSLIHI